MNCIKCNETLEQGVKFCAKCGTQTAAPVQETAPPTPPQAETAPQQPATPPPMAPPPQPQYAPRPPSQLGAAIKESFRDMFSNRTLCIWNRLMQMAAWLVLTLGNLLGLAYAVSHSLRMVMVGSGWSANMVNRPHPGYFLLYFTISLLLTFAVFTTLMTIAKKAKK